MTTQAQLKARALIHYEALAKAAVAFAAEAAQSAHVAPIVPYDPLTDIDKVVDGDLICERAAARQQDAQDRADDERDCNGNARRWE